jgi:PKHD-type hydroxylase
MQLRPIFGYNPYINQTEYYWYKEGFNVEELEWVKNLMNLYSFDIDTIAGSTNPSIIKQSQSKIKYIPSEEKNDWLYEKLMNFANEANNTIWGFDLNSVIDSIRYSEYTEGEYYDWHLDIGPAPINHRKITIITQLSDPTEYEGGELQLWCGDQFKNLPKIKGCTILFPSFFLHRITPITKGSRSSLVLWVGGSTYH